MTSAKQEVAAEFGIEFCLNLGNAPELPLSNAELAQVLFNLYDNAINAAKFAEVKKIDMQMYTDAEMFVIRMENTVGESKEPGTHMGLAIITKTVKKYDGTLLFEQQGDTFLSIVCIPLVKQANTE